MSKCTSVLYRSAVNLPEPVLDRLGDRVAVATVVQRGLQLEARPWSSTEARGIDEGSGTATIAGYSTTFDQPYEVYGGPELYGWMEVMAAGSWAKTIREKDDLRFLENHEGRAFARVSNGTLEVSEDDLGVMNVVSLDVRRQDARDLYYAVDRQDMCEMSCAFRVTRQEWSPDYTERRILEVVGYDSSVVTYPANEATSIVANSAAAQLTDRRTAQRGMSVRAARLELDRMRRRAS